MKAKAKPKPKAHPLAHQRSEDRAKRIETMVAVGTPIEHIAKIERMALRTLYAYYGSELELGRSRANAAVGVSLFQKATGDGPASVTAAIYWMKNRAGWVETQRIEHTGADGGPIKTTSARDRLAHIVATQAAAEEAQPGDNGPH